MTDVRKATLAIDVSVGTALKNIRSVRDEFSKLRSGKSVVLTGGLQSAGTAASTLESQLKSLGAVSRDSLVRMDGDVNDLADDVKKVGSNWDKLSSSLGKFITIGAGVAMVMGGMNLDADTEAIEQNAAARNENADALVKWINAASTIPGVTKDTRAQMALEMQTLGQSSEDIPKSLDAILTFYKNNEATLKTLGYQNAQSFYEGLKSGNANLGSLASLGAVATPEETQKAWSETMSAFNNNAAAPGFNDALQNNIQLAQWTDVLSEKNEQAGDVALTSAQKFELMSTQMTDLAAAIGVDLIPVASVLVTGITSVTDALGPTGTAIAATAVGASALGAGLLMVIGQASAGVEAMIALKTAVMGAEVAQWALNAAMAAGDALNPLAWVALAVVAVGALAYKFGYLQKAIDWIKGIPDYIDSMVKSMEKFTGSTSFGGMILKMVFPAATFLEPVIKYLTQIFNGTDNIAVAAESTVSVLTSFFNWVVDGINGYVTWLKTAWDSLTKTITDTLHLGSSTTLTDAQQEEANAKGEDYVQSVSKKLGLTADQVHKAFYPTDTYLTRTTNGKEEHRWAGDDLTRAEWLKAGWSDATSTITLTADNEKAITDAVATGMKEGTLKAQPQVSGVGTKGELNNIVHDTEVSNLADKMATGERVGTTSVNNLALAWNYGTEALKGFAEGFGLHFAAGGTMPWDGLAYLHQGEQVLNRNQSASNASAGHTYNINTTLYGSASQRDADNLARKIREEIERYNMQNIAYRGRGMIG